MPVSEHLYEFLARVSRDGLTAGRVVGMKVTYMDRFTEEGVFELERVGRTADVDFAGLATLMHDDDLAALKAAVDAEIAGRV